MRQVGMFADGEIEERPICVVRPLGVGAKRVYGIGGIRQSSKAKRPDYYREEDRKRTRARYVRREPWFESVKAALGCQMCGYTHARGLGLDFHHLDRSMKRFCVGKQNLTRRRQSFVEEMGKCALLCATCHKLVHWDDEVPSLQRVDVAALPPMPD